MSDPERTEAPRLTRPASTLRPRFAELVEEGDQLLAEMRGGIAALRAVGQKFAETDTAVLVRTADAARQSGQDEHQPVAAEAEQVLELERRHRELIGRQAQWRSKAVALIEAAFDSPEPLRRFQLGLPWIAPLPRIEEWDQTLRGFEHEFNKLSALHQQLDMYAELDRHATAPMPGGTSERSSAGSRTTVAGDAFFERLGGYGAAAVVVGAVAIVAIILAAIGVDFGPVEDVIRSIRELLT